MEQNTEDANVNIASLITKLTDKIDAFDETLKGIQNWKEDIQNRFTEEGNSTLAGDDMISIDGQHSDLDEEPPSKRKSKREGISGTPRGPDHDDDHHHEEHASSTNARRLDDDLKSLLNEENEDGEIEDDPLDDIAATLSLKEPLGPAVRDKLANVIKRHFFEEKTKTSIKDMLTKHLLPSNLDTITTTRVNTEVWRALPQKTKECDLEYVEIQKPLVAALRPLTLLMSKLQQHSKTFSKEEYDAIINMASDVAALICSANREINMKRRKAIKPALVGDYKSLCSSQVPITEHLFGDKLHDNITDIATTSKISNSLTQPKTSWNKQSSSRSSYNSKPYYPRSSQQYKPQQQQQFRQQQFKPQQQQQRNNSTGGKSF